jgi:cytosine/adenosine deaminase-related metal-dependent hydrolase
VLRAKDVLAMATRDGAAALVSTAGEIAAGKLADLTLVDLRRFHLQPATPEAVETNLVHAARGSDVETDDRRRQGRRRRRAARARRRAAGAGGDAARGPPR